MIKVLSLILAIPLCVAAQAPVQSPSPRTNEPTTGTITGKVVNESGQPMAGAVAFIRSVSSGSGMGRTTATDSEGNFQVGGLAAGLYTVAASAPAYTSIPPDPNMPATYYRIGDTVRLELVRGGVITGTVTNAMGEPLVAVVVRATMIRDVKGQSSRMAGFGSPEQTTDDRGVYRMFGLVPGTYIVSAGGMSSSPPFQFNPYDSDLPTYAPSSARDNAAEVSVRGGEETTADIRYRGEPGYTVSGTVKVAGTNAANITLAPVGGAYTSGGNTYQAPNSRGFAFHGVADGEYELVGQELPISQGFTTPIISRSEPKRITVKGASVSGIELIPRQLASISGRISLEPSKATECQGKRAPIFAETLVQLRRPERESDKDPSLFLRVFGSSVSLDSKGEFTFRNVSPGKYQFEPRFFARYWYVQSITMGAAPPATAAKAQAASSSNDAAAYWTNVKFGEQLTTLTITLAEGAASIRGKMAGGPPSSTVLHLIPSESNKADDVLRFFVTDIGADGTFALNNVPPGRYWVLPQPNTDAQTATVMKLRLPEAAAARTKLRKTAETQKTAIELKPCQNLADYELKP